MTGRDLVPLDPAAGRADERLVRRGFWPKLVRALGLVPFAEEALAGYFCALDPATPARVRAVLFGALAYFVMPMDLIPDFIAGLGFADDASVLLAAIAVVGPSIKERHRAHARSTLERPEPIPEPAKSAGDGS